MLGLLYLLLCFTSGWAFCIYFFPNLSKITELDYGKHTINISPYLLLFPVWFLTGTLALTWPTYLIAYVFSDKAEPLAYANSIVMPIAFLVFALTLYLSFRKSKKQLNKTELLTKDLKTLLVEAILVTAIMSLATILMWSTFYVKDSNLYIGVTVFSDFSPHIGMIRSFSFGNNFPTEYPHFTGEDIRYHFMFQFLAGNLEYLGMRLDYAFNLPSIISFVSAFLMLYILAVKITGKISAGVLACLFFAFRSAKTLYTFLSKLPQGTDVLKTLHDNTDFISDTPHEDWGLWNLNVYCNQRHLAIGLTGIFFVLILMTPHVFEIFERLKKNRLIQFKLSDEAIHKRTAKRIVKRIRDNIKVIFFTADAWLFHDMKKAIAIGMILGSLSFFNGATVIAGLLILFVMAIMSYRRLEYIVVAVIALTLSFLQTHLFIHGSVVTTKFLFGFIAENKTIFGVASYLERLLGILPIIILVAFCIEKGVKKYLIITYTIPLIFAFTISLTIDVTVNHKYIMISCILLGILAAAFIVRIFEMKRILMVLLGVMLIVMLTATGIYDFITVLKKNASQTVTLSMDSPLTDWIDKNSDSKDIFLTASYTVNQVVLGGGMLYEGWSYYPWSAGYDTDTRSKKVIEMYEATTPEKLDALVKENKIRFIIVDKDNRESTDYVVNEANIIATYDCVYTQDEGIGMLSIFDTQKPIY